MITGKRKLEEQCLGLWLGLGLGLGLRLGLGLGLFFVLYFLCCISHVVSSRCIFQYCIYGLNSKLTITMQNIYVTQETKAEMRSNKKYLETKLQQKIEEKQIG